MGTGRFPLTPEQKEASEQLDQSISLLASAGSGKTAVLVERYVNVLRTGVAPSEILCLTFTVDAANQLRRRLLDAVETEDLSPIEKQKWRSGLEATPFLGTLHSFCYRVVEQFGSELSLPRISEILSPFYFSEVFDDHYQNWLETIPSTSFSRWLQYFTHREIRDFLFESYPKRRKFLQRVKHNEGESNEDWEIIRWIAQEAKSFWTGIEASLLSRGIYGFDDLEQGALDLFENSPTALAHYQKRLKFFFVDEFQDTSPEQWKLIQLLSATQPNHLFVVGDPKQSIYRFRHADYRVFYDACRRIKDRGGLNQSLSMNFRSEPRLLSAINHLSEPLFTGTEVGFDAMKPGLEADVRLPQVLDVIRIAAEKADIAQQEKLATLAKVKELLRQGVKGGQIAILFRVSERITDYFDLFLQEDIPAAAKTVQAIFHNYETLDLTNYLYALADPLDNFHFAAFLRSGFLNWSPQEINQALERPGETLFEKLSEDPRLEWFRKVWSSHDCQLETLLFALFRHTGFSPASPETFLQWLTPLTTASLTLGEAIKKIESWKRDGLRATLLSGSDDLNSLQLMTVHGAKGLEFDHVFLVDNLRLPPRSYPTFVESDGKIGLRIRKDGEPHELLDYASALQKHQQDDLEESKRILYVALTRAKRGLHVLLPESEKAIPKNSWGDWLNQSLKRL